MSEEISTELCKDCSKVDKTAYNKFIRHDIATFAKDIDVLRSLVRYQNCHRNVNESVAEHSFYVASFVLKLREYYEFDLQAALKTALIHDVMEARISDVPHNIKVKNPKLAEALEDAESNVLYEMFYPEASILLMNFNHGGTPEGMVVQLADILSVILYANAEIKSGNKVFNYIAIKALDRVRCVMSQLKLYLNPAYTNEQIVNKISQIVDIY